MGPGSFQWGVLAAALAAAGVFHLVVWSRRRKSRSALWLAVACLAGSGTAVTMLEPGARLDAMAGEVRLVLLVLWLVALAWFAVEVSAADFTRRGAVLAVSLLLALVVLGRLPWPAGNRTGWGAASLGLPLLAAVAIVGLLALDGALRLWRLGQRLDAVALAAGMGTALVALALQGATGHYGLASLPACALWAFLVAVALLAREPAGAPVLARHDLGHTSRLAVVGELTASIAHEINQPLGAILSNVDACEILLEAKPPPLEEIRLILADVRRDGLRASDVIRHVRGLVRKPAPELESIDANDLVSDVIALLAPDARRRGIPTSGAVLPEPAWIHGDRAQLQQALINLVLNAMDAIEAQAEGETLSWPPIVIAVRRKAQGEVEISVVDSGPGIPVERLGQLFDTFYTSKPHGMGLGLSIARSVVEAHGGRIGAGNNLGAGATFTVTLPPHQRTRTSR